MTDEAYVSHNIPAVACYNLRKSYGSGFALNSIDLELPQGKIIGILGPNGSGKTTLIKILAGVLQQSDGEALIYGEPPSESTKSIVSYLPERTYFDPGMRVSECINMFKDFYGDFNLDKAMEMLRILGVPYNAKLKTLSKGTREKIQLILVMSRQAKLYLLDEPIGGVDPASRDYIIETIMNSVSPDATVIISTHLIRDIENVLDGFVFIGNGSVIMSGESEIARREHGKSLDEIFREVFRCF